jgi:hypothetical protein
VETVARFGAKVRRVPRWGGAWWTGAVSSRGHGRLAGRGADGRGVVVIRHRFGWALAFGVDALCAARVLGHCCDNPLCQRIVAGHGQLSKPRRETAGSGRPAGTRSAARYVTRGAHGQGPALRDVLRAGARREVLAAVADSGPAYDAAQLPLWPEGGALVGDAVQLAGVVAVAVD